MHSHIRESEIFFTFTDPALVIFPGGASNMGCWWKQGIWLDGNCSMESLWATWYSLDIRDGTRIPIGWPPSQKGNRRKNKSVFTHIINGWCARTEESKCVMCCYRLHQPPIPPVTLFCCQSHLWSCQFLIPWHLTDKWKDWTLSAFQLCDWPVSPAQI